MTDLWLLDSMRHLFADTNLDGIDTIFFFGLYLCDLASIDLDDSAGSEFAPFVPKVSHPNFVAHQAYSF
jgi:hypothetical protein